MPESWRWAWAAILGACGTRAILLHARLRHPLSVTAVEWGRDADGRVSCRTACGDTFRARVLSSTFVSAALTIVNVRAAGRWLGTGIVILPDRVDGEAYRQFRVWLRYRGTARPEAAGITNLQE